MAIISELRQNELVAKAKARSGAALVRKHVPQQLAFWPDDRRAIANELARSALFQCGDNRKARRYFDNEPLYVLGKGVAVTYRGEELRSREEDLFITLAHCARDLPSGKMVVRVTSSELCKMNNWRQDQRYYKEIFESIQRMKGGVITVFSTRLAKALKCQRALAAGTSDAEMEKLYDELERFEAEQARAVELGMEEAAGDEEQAGMMMSLISGDPVFYGFKSVKDGIPQGNVTWEIALDKNMVSLFAAPYLTYLDLEARQQLSPTGKRLQAYFLSHKKPHAILLRKLEKMLSLSFKDIFKLKFKINEELSELKRLKVIYDYEFEKSADGKDWKAQVYREKPESNSN